MQFKKLRLSGFKSFVRPTELLIEPGLTGIVGPNGCGKSNVIEALRWAMGESSARGLRGGEMDDVIFAGTTGRPAYDLAEVALQLDADGSRIAGFEDDDDLELVRRIGRGAGSSFRLNGRELRARDVQLLFADVASGARSASIVSQGQIGALVEAKPQDRRRLLEDAAGVAGLQARRHEAELKLRATEANLVRLEDLLQTLHEQHEQLKKQARQAKRYGEIGARLREVEARLAVGRWLRATAELDQMRDLLAAAGAETSAADARRTELQAVRSAAATELARRREETGALRTERARLAERLRASEQARDERQARVERGREQVGQLERDRLDAERLLGDGRAAVARLAEEHAELGPLIDELGVQRASAGRALERLAADAAEASRHHRAALASHGDLEARLRHAREERARLDQDQRALEVRLHELPVPPDHAEPRSAGMDAAVQTAQAACAAAESAAADAERQAAECEQAREQAREGLRLAADRAVAAEQAVRDAAQDRARQEQMRKAFSDRLQELANRLERLQARKGELRIRRTECTAALEKLALGRLEQARHEGDSELAAAEASCATAEAALEAARQALTTAASGVRELAGESERLEAEAAALAEIGTGELHPPVLERINAPQHLTAAIAAGLGDDLLASLDHEAPARWDAPAAEAKDALPDGARPLAELVDAPATLQPRLRQIGLCDPTAGARLQSHLAAGQRLVSEQGDLWRWDGFTRRADALHAVAARLRQHKRRRDLGALLTTLRTRLEAAREEESSAALAVRAAEAELAVGTEARAACAARQQEAAHLLGEGRATERALQAELASLDEGLGRAQDEIDELEAARAEAHALQQASADAEAEPDPGLERARDEARRANDDALAAERAAADRQDQARTWLAETRSDVERSRRALENARQAAHAAEVEARERRHAAERHSNERERLAAERDAVGRRAAELDASLAGLGREIEQARAVLDAAEAALDRLNAAETAALAEGAALDARHQAAEHQRSRLQGELDLWQAREADASERLAKIMARELLARDELRAAVAAAEASDGADDPLSHELAALDRRLAGAETTLRETEAAQVELERRIEAADDDRANARERMVRLEGEVERLDGVRTAAEAALRARPLPPDLAVDEEVPEPSVLASLDEERARLEVARERLGAINLRALDELRELELRLETLSAERDELAAAVERLLRAIGALNREGRERLKTAFVEIEKHFEALFVRLFGGGEARLSLTDLEDPLAAGLELAASPPGKKLQSLSLLSGGEKALTALALIFAVFLSRPAPLCVLDEVDAPLDDANVERLAALLGELAAGTLTRFIVVTHHPLTMAHMDRLYGVTMLERGVSELVSVDLSRAIELRRTA